MYWGISMANKSWELEKLYPILGSLHNLSVIKNFKYVFTNHIEHYSVSTFSLELWNTILAMLVSYR